MWEGEAGAAQSLLTRSVQEGPCRTGHAAEATPVAVLLQPLLPSSTRLGAHGDGGLRGAQQPSGSWWAARTGQEGGQTAAPDGQLAAVL